MRTTVDIDGPVLERLKKTAERRRLTLGQLASELLARALKEQADEPPAAEFRWRPAAMGAPRLDLEDKDRLWAVLDGPAVATDRPPKRPRRGKGGRG